MGYLISVNIIGFVLMFIDKKKAIYHKWRISEAMLLFIALIGGCYGIVIGMSLFRHKTKKLKFKLVYLLCIIDLIIIMKNY